MFCNLEINFSEISEQMRQPLCFPNFKSLPGIISSQSNFFRSKFVMKKIHLKCDTLPKLAPLRTLEAHCKQLQQILPSICLLIETLDDPGVKFDIFMFFKMENKQNLSSLRWAELGRASCHNMIINSECIYSHEHLDNVNSFSFFIGTFFNELKSENGTQ